MAKDHRAQSDLKKITRKRSQKEKKRQPGNRRRNKGQRQRRVATKDKRKEIREKRQEEVMEKEATSEIRAAPSQRTTS